MADRVTNGGGTATDLGVMARMITAAKFVISGAGPEAWFGPSQPIAPSAPEEVKGRAFDYPVAYNTNLQPRSNDPISFQQMRNMADGYDLLRIVLETVKDQIATQEWQIKPKDPKAKADKRCDEVANFLRFPDQEHDHATWLRSLLEEMLVIDACTIYPRMTKGGKLYALEAMDGSTIKRVLAADGRTPLPPDPAYQQVLKGIPAVDYSRDELIYLPRNVRTNKVYGYSPVEQIIMTVNIALRRQLHQLEFYTEGNTPDLLFRVPETWQPDQIRQMQLWWDTLINDTASRRRAKFIPGGVDPYDTKTAALKDEYDEWLARVVCFCFSVSSQPFVKEMNRATAATSKEASKEEGKGPRMLWVKHLHDFIIWKYFGYQDLEFGWQDQTAVDAKVQADIDAIYLTNYIISPEEVRARIGLEGPPPEKPAPPVMIAGPEDDNADNGTNGNNTNVSSGLSDGGKAGKGSDTGKTGSNKPDEAKAPVEKADTPDVTRIKKKSGIKPIDRNRKAVVKARNSFTKTLKEFFEIAADDIADQIGVAIEKLNRVDSDIEDQARKILADLDMQGWTVLIDPAKDVLEAVYADGAHEALAQIGIENKDHLTDQLNERSLLFAEDRGAELVGMRNMGTAADPEWIENPDAKWAITDSTRDMLRVDTAKAIEEGWSTNELKASLKENYAFSDARAETIARTEIAKADVEGNIDTYRTSGVVTGKEWILGSEHDDDDECNENADAGVVGLDEAFPSGDDAAPTHPNCVCDILPVVMDTEDQGQE